MPTVLIDPAVQRSAWNKMVEGAKELQALHRSAPTSTLPRCLLQVSSTMAAVANNVCNAAEGHVRSIEDAYATLQAEAKPTKRR